MKLQQRLLSAEFAEILGGKNWMKSHNRFETQLPSGKTLVIVSDVVSGELLFFIEQEVADYTQAVYKAAAKASESVKTGCGAHFVIGHGETAICGKEYRGDPIWICYGCKSKPIKAKENKDA